VATTLSDLQATQAASLTTAYKAQANRDAAKAAALIALYYQQRVDPSSVESVERWLELMVPRLIVASDTGADRAAIFFDTIRRLEVGVNAPSFKAEAAKGFIDDGVRKSLLAVGPYDYANKVATIERLDVSPQQQRALLAEAKRVTAGKVASAVVRHAQAGGRQTIHENSQRDEVALGWVRVTKAKPCAFCAMLASRGLQYRAFKEGSFDLSDARFTGDGDAKVHDNCGCSLKPVYSKNDPLVDRTKQFADMWSMWGAGGGDAALRFRRGYEHWRESGDFLTWDQANAA
jgi:hypothetical protein